MRNIFLLGSGLREHLVKGSPLYPSWHVHTGIWLNVWHWAAAPQDPGHGSRHFSLMHAWLLGQSELITHSGLQFGGIPMNVGRHEQAGDPSLFWHRELKPHGDGTQGSIGNCWTGAGNGAVKICMKVNIHYPKGRRQWWLYECSSNIIRTAFINCIKYMYLPSLHLFTPSPSLGNFHCAPFKMRFWLLVQKYNFIDSKPFTS
jgi:hypothetical protein